MNKSDDIDLKHLDTTGRVPLVLIIGPPEHTIGGMATVVAQQRSLALGKRYTTAFFPITLCSDEGESVFLRLVRHVRHLHKLYRTIQRLNPAVVHIHTCSGFSFYRSVVDLLIAKMNSCTVVMHIHGAAFDKFFRSCSGLGQCAIRWSLAQADSVVALSLFWRQSLAAMSPRARIVVIENAVQANASAQAAKATGFPSSPEDHHEGCGIQTPASPRHCECHQPCRFLMLARMDTWKGVDDLLDALVHLRHGVNPTPQSLTDTNFPGMSSSCDNSVPSKTKRSVCGFECILAGPAGSAGDEATLTKKIESRSLGDHVRYVGAIQAEQRDQWLDWADVLVQPSHHEGMPIAMLEALAVGLPVIATKVGAVPEVIADHVEGLLIPPHSPIELAAALQTIAHDRTLREKLGQAGRLLARSRFGLDRLDADLVQLYDGLIAGSGREAIQEKNSDRCVTIPAIHRARAAGSA